MSPPANIDSEEILMIELTDEQRRELAEREPVAIDPQTQQVYVLVRKETYERLKELVYDDSPWTDEEMDLLAEEAGELLDEYRP
jgi:PHD/YefM family antitoxin component YafN of YafNO toxin-antitoxin module